MPRFDSIDDAVKDIRRGRMAIVIDDPTRENEGDLVIAAEKCTERAINFMALRARGLICVPMLGSRLDALKLRAMVDSTHSAGPGPGRDTAFSVSVDADRKSTRLNSSHIQKSRMPSSA